MTQERDQKRHQKCDFETGHVYLLFDCRWSPTACQSLTFLQDSSTSDFVDAHKNLQGYMLYPNDVSTTHLVAGHASDGQSENR